VANQSSNDVSVIDTATNTNLGIDIGVGAAPSAIAITPDGARAYVTNFFNDDDVSVIDTATNTNLGADVGVGAAPIAIAITPDGARAYVANAGDNDVSVIDTATNTNLGIDIGVGGSPFGIAITPAQPPDAAFEIASQAASIAGGGASTPVVQTGVPADLDASASTDPDGAIADYAWDFGDGQSGSGGPTTTHAYTEPGTYTARLTLTDDEGCSTELVFTGQTAYCPGGPEATTTREVRVENGLAGLKLKLAKKAKSNKLKATATCRAAACDATLRGNVRVNVHGASAAARPIKSKSVSLAASTKTKVKLKLRRGSISRALRKGHRVKGTVRARAADAFDNVERAKARKRLR
jgi:YVTN family beta-propeller protein